MKDYSKKLTSEQKTVKAFTDPLSKRIERLTLENKKLTEQLRIAVVSGSFLDELIDKHKANKNLALETVPK
jgi:hypothetical protein